MRKLAPVRQLGMIYPSGSRCPIADATRLPKSVQFWSETCANAEAPIVRLCWPVPRSVLVDHAAEILGVSRRTVYYRIREGKLRTVRTRCGSQRVLVDSIEALLLEQVTKAEMKGKRESKSKSKKKDEPAEPPAAAADAGPVTIRIVGASDTTLCVRSRVLWQQR